MFNDIESDFWKEQLSAMQKNNLLRKDSDKLYMSDCEEKFEEFKRQLINEFNELHIEGMPKVEKLNALVGGYINLEYRLPNGQTVKFLDDNATYLGNQLESLIDDGRYFGILANADFLMVSSYGKDGEAPELLLYKKRQN